MMYDIDGNPIGSDSGNVKQALLELIASGEINLGAQVGATLVYNGIKESWITNAETQYNALKTKYKNTANYSIPFFISTDQHGRGLEQHRWANNIDKDGLNFLNINLGDTVQSVYGETVLDGILGRTKQIKNYVGVVGNHDANNPNGQPTTADLTKYFFSNYDRKVITGDSSSYAFVDGNHNVRCIISDSYLHDGSNYTNDAISSAYSDWLISELSKDDHDILFLQHWMLYATRGTYSYRDGTAQSTDNIGGSPLIRKILSDRKAKTSGSITDMDGIAHTYDFTGCKHDLLCCLHGHQHEEIWAKLDGVLCYVADWYGNNHSCVFGLIDRLSQKLFIWKFDDSQTYEEFSMNL